MRPLPLLALVGAAVVWTGCGRDDPLDEMTVVREEIPHEVAVLIDAGNAAYRAGDYETARQHYRGAASRDSTVAAAWYGVAMSERALGNTAAADSALSRLGDVGATAAPHHTPDSAARLSPHGSPHGSPGSAARDSTQT